MRALSLVLAAALAGCGDDAQPNGDGGGAADLSAVADGGADQAVSAPDLTLVDATCALHRFSGFFTGNPTEQRLDCTCGCIIDDFDSNIVNGYWGKPTAGNATLEPMAGVGLAIALATPDGGGASVGAVNSLSPVEPFWLDGDFDLLVDYSLSGPLPDDAHVLLTVQDTSATGHYIVGRERLSGTGDVYSATLGGIAPVTISTTAASGTLELQRNGSSIKALADGSAVSQFTGAGTARVQLILTGALASCPGTGCAFTVTFHNARMMRGAITDRP
ncbi:MAG TPA: hypothetical protein VFF06_35535 [Polyangia bacterium]|nr:hypothetical protein [Polyangia bacterium]